MKLIGALTSKPYAFKARPWELENISTLDYHDASGTNIKVSLRGSEILRILPKINNNINEEWISDKTRFSYDGLNKQRIFSPLLKLNNKFKKITWQEAFEVIKEKYDKGFFFEGICGNLIERESLLLFKEFINKIGNSSIEGRNTNLDLNSDLRSNYLMNTSYNNINYADSCILFGSNPRIESPILNIRIRKNVIKNNLKVYTIGFNFNPTYKMQRYYGNSKTLLNIIEGKHKICNIIINSKNPVIYVGISLLQQYELLNVFSRIIKPLVTRQNWNGFNILQQNSTLISVLEFNCTNNKHSKDFANFNKVIYIFNCDEIYIKKRNNDFVIYQGHTGDNMANKADLILPGSTLLEKNGSLINNMGKIQNLNFCSKPPADARNDYKIFEAVSNYLNINIVYLKIKNIEKRILEIAPERDLNWDKELINNIITSSCYINNGYLLPYIHNFYMTNVIDKNSHIMALATNRFKKNRDNFNEII